MTDRFEAALVYAAHLHREQRRKGSDTPYVAHLLAVASLVIEDGGDEDEAIAALLHDAIEDQGGDATRQEIARRFGARVVSIVDECTDTDETPKPPWRERKERYLAHLETATPEARRITTCDKLHNARCLLQDYAELGEELWGRFNGGRDGTLWYYRRVVDILEAGGKTGAAARELAAVVSELEKRAAVAGRA